MSREMNNHQADPSSSSTFYTSSSTKEEEEEEEEKEAKWSKTGDNAVELNLKSSTFHTSNSTFYTTIKEEEEGKWSGIQDDKEVELESSSSSDFTQEDSNTRSNSTTGGSKGSRRLHLKSTVESAAKLVDPRKWMRVGKSAAGSLVKHARS